MARSVHNDKHSQMTMYHGSETNCIRFVSYVFLAPFLFTVGAATLSSLVEAFLLSSGHFRHGTIKVYIYLHHKIITATKQPLPRGQKHQSIHSHDTKLPLHTYKFKKGITYQNSTVPNFSIPRALHLSTPAHVFQYSYLRLAGSVQVAPCFVVPEFISKI